MKDGWIKLWRKISDSDMYAELTCQQRDVLIQCLLLANHKEEEWEWRGKVFKCKSGQFVTSLKSLKNRCAKNVSIRNIRTSLDKLEKWEFLTNKATKNGRLITIINWVFYQDIENEPTKKVTKKRQRSDKEVTTNKNVKNDKEVKKEKYAEFVKFTPKEYRKLQDRYGTYHRKLMIEELNNYKASTGKTYKSDYHTILRWVADEILEKYPIGPGHKEFKDDRSPNDKLVGKDKWEELKGEIKKIGRKQ